VRKFLLGTRLFIEKQSKEQIPKAQGYLVALIWVAMGLLLTLQTDWMLSYFVPKTQTPASITSSATTSSNKAKKTTPKVMPTFNARQLDEQLTLYRQRLQKTGHPPDILIVGSSRALRGIDPVALSKGLGSRGLGNMDVFNFGINGATAQVVDFILRKVLEPQELPKMIVWGDGSRAFNNARSDLTFRTIAASPGYKLINNSKHENSYQDLDQWLNQSLGTVSTTYQNRDRLKAFLGEGLVKALSAFGATTAKPNKDSDQETSAQKVDSNGFLPLSIRFDPSTYYQKHPKVSGRYDNDYTPFALNGGQDLAFQAVLRFTQVKKISLVFVNMPLTAEYLDPVRTQHEQEFQRYMLQASAKHSNFLFRNLSLLYPQSNGFFSDPSHLNRYGAYEVSKVLAKDSRIPWNKKGS
jgi:hypothetical protein